VSNWYRVMCDRKHPLTPVCDIEHDKSGKEAKLYDRLVAGEIPMLDSFGQPVPGAAVPPRRASREVTIYPVTGIKAPAGTVDIPDINTQVQAKAQAIREGKPPPKFPSGWVRTADVEVGEEQHTDGHKFRLACRCGLLVPQASAGTIALVLDKIGGGLDTIDVELREQDESRKWVTRPITVRLLPLLRLCAELGKKPRG
jgi:hypothetical protein